MTASRRMKQIRKTTSAILLLDKGEGVTSFDALRTLKRAVGKKAGHAGTLDRFASGLLVCFSGSFTRLCNLFMDLDKVYEARVQLGVETDTLDPDGNVVLKAPVPGPEEVLKAIEAFPRDYDQCPPLYSAVHIDGERAYKKALRGHDFSTMAKPVSIKSLEVLGQGPDWVDLRLKVSKGFYVRSFASELGRAAGSCAHLTRLRRISIGPFNVKDAIAFDDEDEILRISRLSCSWFFDSLGSRDIECTDEQAKGLRNGNLAPQLRLEGLSCLYHEGKLLWVEKDARLICQGEGDE